MKKLIPQRYKFIIKLGRALHTYGVQSYKIQYFLKQVAERKGVKGAFMDNPTWINYVFYEEEDQTYNYIETLQPGEINLGALSQIVEITNQVLDREITFIEASKLMDEIDQPKTRKHKIIEFIAFFLSGPAFCVILNTNWISAMSAAIACIFIYFLYANASKSDYLSSTLESIVALTSTIIIGSLSVFFPEINISLSILASIIIFIPGLSITTALEEITSYNLISGTAKFAGSMVSLFKQFFGVMLGLAILTLFTDIHQIPTVDNIPSWVNPIAIFCLIMSLLPVFGVRVKDMFLCVIVGFISFYTTNLLEPTGLLISVFIGTLTLVFASKYFSRISNSPKLVFLMPGIVMLVPGSKAFIGLSSVFGTASADTPSNMWMQVAYILMGIIGGLLFSGSFMSKKDHIKS
ncbi:MAG: threonine/serine exporter family protein [Marinifilaceae bacterium]